MPSNALPRMPSLLDGFFARMRKTRSPNTALAYEKIARAFFVRAPESSTPDARVIEDFITTSGRSAPYATATRNHRLGALKALAKHAFTEGYWSEDPTRDLSFVQGPSRDPAVLSIGEVQRLFGSVETTSPPQQLARNHAMLAVLFTLGLRVHELVGLDVEQVDAFSASLISVRGKGRTVHDLPLEPATLALVLAWLKERGTHTKLDEQALFVSRLGRRMSTRAVQRLFQKLRVAIGTRKKLTPHTARHSAATLAIMGGADVSSVGELLRHADINVTRRYIRLIDTRKRQVAELLSHVIPVALRPTPSGACSAPDATLAPRVEAAEPPSSTRPATHDAANDNAFLIDRNGHFPDVG